MTGDADRTTSAKISPDLRLQIETALARDNLVPTGDEDAVNLLVNAYHGYKNAYEDVAPRLGVLRSVAAPVIREQVDEKLLGKPSIFLATLPKSGTVYISSALKATLEYDLTTVMVSPTFPKNIIWPSMVSDFVRGGMISASHMQPDRINIDTLKRFGVNKGILHIRDPRAALASWYHFFATYSDVAEGANAMGRVAVSSRAAYRALPKSAQIDSHIDGFFRHCVDWISGWMNMLESDEQLDFLVLTHEELTGREEAYLQTAISFFGIATDTKLVAKNDGTHFRKGDNSSWREDLTPEQLARVNAMIPDWMWTRFNWEK